MAQEFDGPVVVKGKLEAKTVRVDGVQIKGEVEALLINGAQANVGLVESSIVACDTLRVRGTPQAPGTPAAIFEPSSPSDPAAQFKGHVGVDGTISTEHVSAQGNISALGNVNAGNMNVTGDILLANADCAEDFDITEAESIEPGTVMVLGEEGTLHQSQQAYDKRVAGVISGAGDYKPGIVLDKQPAQSHRKPLALLGKVYCKWTRSLAQSKWAICSRLPRRPVTQ